MANELLLRDLLSTLKDRFSSPFAPEPGMPPVVQNRVETLLSVMDETTKFAADEFLAGCLILAGMNDDLAQKFLNPLIEAAVRAIRIGDPDYLTPSTILAPRQYSLVLRIWYSLPMRLNLVAQAIATGNTQIFLPPENRRQMITAYVNLSQQMHVELGMLIEAMGS